MSHYPYGLVLGRFQPLHIGHMEFLEAARHRCGRLIVGITNPDIRTITFQASDPNRSRQESNPFTFFQRFQMIERALGKAGWQPQQFAILPADIAQTPALTALLPEPSRTVVLATIYDEWGEEKAQRMRQEGFSVEILWRRSMAERATSGTEIRGLMARGAPWRHLVPEGVAEMLVAHTVDSPRVFP